MEKYLGQLYRKLGIKRTYVKREMKEAAKAENAPKAEAGAFLDDATRQALAPVLARFTRPIRLRLYTDDSQMTEENRRMVMELASLSDKVEAEFVPSAREEDNHTISICDAEGNEKDFVSTAYPADMNLILLFLPCTMRQVRGRTWVKHCRNASKASASLSM